MSVCFRFNPHLKWVKPRVSMPLIVFYDARCSQFTMPLGTRGFPEGVSACMCVCACIHVYVWTWHSSEYRWEIAQTLQGFLPLTYHRHYLILGWNMAKQSHRAIEKQGQMIVQSETNPLLTHLCLTIPVSKSVPKSSENMTTKPPFGFSPTLPKPPWPSAGGSRLSCFWCF